MRTCYLGGVASVITEGRADHAAPYSHASELEGADFSSPKNFDGLAASDEMSPQLSGARALYTHGTDRYIDRRKPDHLDFALTTRADERSIE